MKNKEYTRELLLESHTKKLATYWKIKHLANFETPTDKVPCVKVRGRGMENNIHFAEYGKCFTRERLLMYFISKVLVYGSMNCCTVKGIPSQRIFATKTKNVCPYFSNYFYCFCSDTVILSFCTPLNLRIQ